jgi:hypothetical protein
MWGFRLLGIVSVIGVGAACATIPSPWALPVSAVLGATLGAGITFWISMRGPR